MRVAGSACSPPQVSGPDLAPGEADLPTRPRAGSTHASLYLWDYLHGPCEHKHEDPPTGTCRSTSLGVGGAIRGDRSSSARVGPPAAAGSRLVLGVSDRPCP